MKQYYYTDGKEKYGPFELEDFQKIELYNEYLIWYAGLEFWIPVEIVSELKPYIRYNKTTNKESKKSVFPQKKSISKTTTIIIGFLLIIGLSLLLFSLYKNSDDYLYEEIRKSAYDTDENLDMYVDKFYRDLKVFNIQVNRPSDVIIRFADFKDIKPNKHNYCISLGAGNDSKIEIYLNKVYWDKMKKPIRYYVMYHALAHDVLNLEDLPEQTENYGKLMFPNIGSYTGIKMDDFIEASHAQFEETAKNSN